jgi:hypothetical protein
MRCSTGSMMAMVAVLGAATVWCSEASAQVPPVDPATPAATPPANQDMAATVRTENGRRVYVASTTIEVRGEIQRPYAFSVSGRSSLGYSYFEAPIHFIREIVDAVRRAPF